MKIQNIIDSIYNHDEFAIKNKRKAEIKAFLETTITSDDFSYITVYRPEGAQYSEGLSILVSTDFCFYCIFIGNASQSFTCVSIKSLQKIEYEQLRYDYIIKVSILFSDYNDVYKLVSTDSVSLKFFEDLRSKANLLT